MLIYRYVLLLPIIFLCQFSLFGQKTASDTTFILRENKKGIYHAIFIDNNKSSKYYNWINKFKFSGNDSISYKESFKYAPLGKTIRLLKKQTANLPKKWCPLYLYKGKYYVYAPSDWGYNTRYKITDTTIIKYDMDGPYPGTLNRFQQIDRNTFAFSYTSVYQNNNKLTIHIIDWVNKIAVFEEASQAGASGFYLMVSAGNLKSFPIVVNYCEMQKQKEFKFDEPDFKVLLKKQ